MELYFITHSVSKYTPFQQVKYALQSGKIQWIQLRMKHSSEKDILSWARKIMGLKKYYNFYFIVNDYPHIAIQCGADGCHIGKNDIPVNEARKILGQEKILGYTINHVDDLTENIASQVNYLGIGPYAYTETKEKLSPVQGYEGIKHILYVHQKRIEQHHLKIFVIGGVQWKDLPLIATLPQVNGVAFSGMLLQSPGIQKNIKILQTWK